MTPCESMASRKNNENPKAVGENQQASKGKGKLDQAVNMKRQCADLNFYLNYILDKINLHPPKDDVDGSPVDVFEENVFSILRSISEVCPAKSKQYGRVFQPMEAGPNKRLHIEIKDGQKHATIPVYLKRPLYPDMYEVRAGQLCGLPPGFALYRLKGCANAEELNITRKMWRGCLDKDDFLSPLKIYPWFAKAILDAVIYLREREPDWGQVRFRLHAVFPTVHLTVKVSKHIPMCLASRSPSGMSFSRRSSTSSRLSKRGGRLSRSTVIRLGSRHGSSDTIGDSRANSTTRATSVYTSLRTNDLDAYSLRLASSEDAKSTPRHQQRLESPARRSDDGIMAQEDMVDPAAPPPRECASRNSQIGMFDNLRSRLGSALGSADRDATDTIHLHLIPSIEGFGWPKAARFPQLLPSQRPWSLLTKDWISELKDRIRDGDSFWGLRAVDPKELKSLYPGHYIPLWRIHYTAAQDFMAMKINQMPVANTLDVICELFNQMNNGLDAEIWAFLGERAKRDVKVKAIKSGIHVNKTLPEWFLALLSSTIAYLKENGEIRVGKLNNIKPGDVKTLIKYMEEVELVCTEEPRRLMEMINMNNEHIQSPSGAIKVPEEHREYLRTSTPLDIMASTSTLAQDVKAVEEPKVRRKKPRRMIYRLFRKDF